MSAVLEQLLLLGGLEAHRRRDQVRERARVLGVRGCELELVGQVGDEADDAAEERLDVARRAPRPPSPAPRRPGGR